MQVKLHADGLQLVIHAENDSNIKPLLKLAAALREKEVDCELLSDKDGKAYISLDLRPIRFRGNQGHAEPA